MERLISEHQPARGVGFHDATGVADQNCKFAFPKRGRTMAFLRDDAPEPTWRGLMRDESSKDAWTAAGRPVREHLCAGLRRFQMQAVALKPGISHDGLVFSVDGPNPVPLIFCPFCGKRLPSPDPMPRRVSSALLSF
jgi:hypothetical protein